MEGVSSVRKTSYWTNYSIFFLYPDLIYHKFDEEVKYKNTKATI